MVIEYLDENWTEEGRINGQEFIRHIHQMADDDLDALGLRHGDDLDTGTGVPHFALNLLDYKLWRLSEIEKRPPAGLPAVRASGFRFAYRTSIEHTAQAAKPIALRPSPCAVPPMAPATMIHRVAVRLASDGPSGKGESHQ
jgi:hypothetical protein